MGRASEPKPHLDFQNFCDSVRPPQGNDDDGSFAPVLLMEESCPCRPLVLRCQDLDKRQWHRLRPRARCVTMCIQQQAAA